MKEEVLIAAARANFWAFCLYWDFDFFYKKRPFLYKIAVAFQKIYDRIILTLAISMPPRAGKSYITSLYCAWVIGKEPDQSIMRNSTTATLYRKFSYDVRGILKDPKFKEVFPGVELSEDKQSVEGWNVTDAVQVTYFGNGVGGTIIGFGASRIAITDDLYRGHEDAMSKTINDSVHMWYNSAHKSRIEKGCAQIDIGTRWSISDVIGVNIENGFYDEVITIPAMINGKSFCEDVKTTEEYFKLKNETHSVIWESEYMQQPAELEGTYFPLSQLKHYTELNDEGTNLIYIDPADEGGDHLAAPIAKMLNGNLYITDAIFNLANLTINEEVVKERFDRHKIDNAFVEANNFGAYFVRNIRIQNPTIPIQAVKNQTNKHGRILAQSGWILEHCYFPEKPNDELFRFIRQMCSVTKDTKDGDDAADAMAGLAAAVRRVYYI